MIYCVVKCSLLQTVGTKPDTRSVHSLIQQRGCKTKNNSSPVWSRAKGRRRQIDLDCWHTNTWTTIYTQTTCLKLHVIYHYNTFPAADGSAIVTLAHRSAVSVLTNIFTKMLQQQQLDFLLEASRQIKWYSAKINNNQLLVSQQTTEERNSLCHKVQFLWSVQSEPSSQTHQ